MKKPDPGDDGPPTNPRPGPGSFYHLASIAMPFLGLTLAIGFLSLTPDFGGLNHWPTISKQDQSRIAQAFWLLGIAGVVGLFLAGKSIAAKEKPGYLPVLGMFLNVPPVLLWLLKVAEGLIDRTGFK